MLIVLSPAKKMNFETQSPEFEKSQPHFEKKTRKLILELKKLDAKKIGDLMKLSSNLAKLNFDRYQNFSSAQTKSLECSCLFAFQGDTYKGLAANSLNQKDLNFLKQHLRILSGLYGILRPEDRIRPYRLEMGTKFSIGTSSHLYEFWKKEITEFLNDELDHMKSPCLINLASKEYFSAIDKTLLRAKIITPIFKEIKEGKEKVIGLYAKRARGMMARFLAQKQVKSPESMKDFQLGGYLFDAESSNDSEYIFKRRCPS